ncbi:MAG: type VI secretion system protein TssL, long form [Alphaproteobacteria bacterium]|nr:type VI secretion system protein TssL, long form [Alphaproteobacteria bacterium]
MTKDENTINTGKLWQQKAPGSPGGNDSLAGSGELPAYKQPAQLAPEPSREERLAAVRAAVNPLLEAAQPLLRALCELPEDLSAEQMDTLHALLEQEVRNFQSICSSAQIRHEHMVAASYALCTAIDEAALRRHWGGGSGGEAGAWAMQGLAHEFHDDIEGGDKVFQLIGRLAAAPQEHTDLLDLLYFILSLGFEGRFRGMPQGRQQLDTIRHRLHEMVMTARGEVPRELSPHWRGESAGKFRFLRLLPVWVTASVLALALLGQFTWYKYQLLHQSAEVEANIRAIGALRPSPTRVLRLKELLAQEIERGTVSVEEDDAHSAVSFKGDDMFVPAQAQVNPKILPLVAKVAGEINAVSGAVSIVGHSDSLPIRRTPQFPNNQILSEKRAAAVAEVLKSNGMPAERLTVEGKGDTQPLASNATAAGRARNRRVDIVVTQGDMPPATSSRAAAPREGSES